jgi:hypothetical protein
MTRNWQKNGKKMRIKLWNKWFGDRRSEIDILTIFLVSTVGYIM